MQRFLFTGLFLALLSGCGPSPTTQTSQTTQTTMTPPKPSPLPGKTTPSAVSPLKLTPGQPICQEGEKIQIPAGTFLKKHAKAPSGEPPAAVRKTVKGNSQGGDFEAPSLQFMPKGDNLWTYTIRPLKGNLRFHVKQGAIQRELQEDNDFIIIHQDCFFESNPGIIWIDQPYKVEDRKGNVVYQTP